MISEGFAQRSDRRGQQTYEGKTRSRNYSRLRIHAVDQLLRAGKLSRRPLAQTADLMLSFPRPLPRKEFAHRESANTDDS